MANGKTHPRHQLNEREKFILQNPLWLGILIVENIQQQQHKHNPNKTNLQLIRYNGKPEAAVSNNGLEPSLLIRSL